MAWPNVYGIDTAQLSRAGVSRRGKPVILLIHDAFHSPGHLELLAAALRAVEYKVLVPQLPSTSRHLVPNSLEADVRTLIDSAKTEIDNGHNVIVVAHGYGSVPGCIAADRLDQYSMDRPRAGQITKLLIIAGVILRPHQAYYDVLNPNWVASRAGLLAARQPETIFFQDTPPELTQWATSLVSFQNEDSLRTRVSVPGWNRLPVLYALCENDNAIPSTAQHAFVATLQQFNPQTAVVGLQTGHCPFLSRTRDVAQLILRLCA